MSSRARTSLEARTNHCTELACPDSCWSGGLQLLYSRWPLFSENIFAVACLDEIKNRKSLLRVPPSVLFLFVCANCLIWTANQNILLHRHTLRVIRHAQSAEKLVSGVQLLPTRVWHVSKTRAAGRYLSLTQRLLNADKQHSSYWIPRRRKSKFIVFSVCHQHRSIQGETEMTRDVCFSLCYSLSISLRI